MENKLTYTSICNPNPFHSVNSNVSGLPTGYGGPIRLYDPLDQGLDFLITEINNNINEDPSKKLSLYIQDNQTILRVIDASYENYKLGTLIFNLYDELGNFVDANITPERINITIPNYKITPGNSYFFIEPEPGTPNEIIYLLHKYHQLLVISLFKLLLLYNFNKILYNMPVHRL